MNRRKFFSMLAGAAGAPLVPWRGLIEPLIALPAQFPIADGVYRRYSGFEVLNIENDEPLLQAAEYGYTELVSNTWRQYAAEIARNVTSENALFRRLTQRG
jgi:hypothetical protein